MLNWGLLSFYLGSCSVARQWGPSWTGGPGAAEPGPEPPPPWHGAPPQEEVVSLSASLRRGSAPAWAGGGDETLRSGPQELPRARQCRYQLSEPQHPGEWWWLLIGYLKKILTLRYFFTEISLHCRVGKLILYQCVAECAHLVRQYRERSVTFIHFYCVDFLCGMMSGIFHKISAEGQLSST